MRGEWYLDNTHHGEWGRYLDDMYRRRYLDNVHMGERHLDNTHHEGGASILMTWGGGG